MSTFKFMTYEEWIEQNPNVAKTEEDCPDCSGTGFQDCPHCGQTMACESCEGEGKVNSAREQYEIQLTHDKKIADRFIEIVTTVHR